MDHRPSSDLLESTHAFPGVYRIKAIGSSDGGFADRVLAAAAEEVASMAEIDYSIRETPAGRHVAVTMDISVQTADQVRSIYEQIRRVEGIALVF